MDASARLLTRATHPFCRLKLSDISPVPSGELNSTTLRSARYDVILNGCISLIFLLCPPKLVHLKFANKSQTVGKRYQGWRGVNLQRHLNEGAAG